MPLHWGTRLQGKPMEFHLGCRRLVTGDSEVADNDNAPLWYLRQSKEQVHI